MKGLRAFLETDPLLIISVLILTSIGVFLLNLLTPALFPNYYLYIVFGLVMFYVFSRFNFNTLSLLSNHFYIISIILLLLPLIIGQATRGVIRWIPLGSFSIQPSEIVRPFLLLFSAHVTSKIKTTKVIPYLFYHGLPVLLILIQPSLGVAVLTAVSFAGVIIASSFDKKKLLLIAVGMIFCLPILWGLMADYQRARVVGFLNPFNDPHGAGYNSIQSMIAVGSGGMWGKGVGKGIQTQLDFLPEKHTDFIFAALSEELGFFGSLVLFSVYCLFFLRIIKSIEVAKNPTIRLYVSGVFIGLLFETGVHVGMNLGLLPITGVTLPLISAGGSSYLATMISLGIIISSHDYRLS